MKGRVSPGTQRSYPLTMICAVYRVPRSSVYAAGAPPSSAARAKKPGPKTRHSDADVIEAIRAVLAACPFHGEGYRKVRARLAHRGLHLGGKRVLRLMRTHGLLAPRRYPQAPAMLWTSVVLPAPNSPTSATTSPGLSSLAKRRPQASISSGPLSAKVREPISL